MMKFGFMCVALTFASSTASARECPVGREFWTTGSWRGCTCPAGYHKKYTAPFSAKAVCEQEVTVEPVHPICEISCVSPPAGCRYEGQVLSGPCSKVTCGKLVCDTPTHRAPSDAYIVDVHGKWPGCPEGSISHRIRSDRQAFILDFSRMQLHHPPGGMP